MPLNNPFRSDRTHPRYRRHDNRAPNNPKYQRTYEEELAYSYDHPSNPKDSRKKQPGLAPSKYDYDRDYPESYGDSMMQDYPPPSRKDSRMDDGEIPIGFSTQSTLVGADFEDQQSPSKKSAAPPPITTLNSLKFSSKPPKALHGQPKEWRRYARRSVLHNATKGYREAYDKHKAKKSKGGPEKRSGQGQYLPTEARATLNDATTYQVASDRPHAVDRKDSYDVVDTAPPPPPPHHKSLHPKKATGFDRLRQPKESDDRSRVPLRRDEILNDPRALKHPRPVKDYDDASPMRPWKSKGSKRAHEIGLRIQDYRDKARTRKPKNEKRGNPYEFDDGDEERGDDRRFSFVKKEGRDNIRQPKEAAQIARADKKAKKYSSKDSNPKHRTQAPNDIAGLRDQITTNAVTLYPNLILNASHPTETFFTVVTSSQSNGTRTYIAYLTYPRSPAPPGGGPQHIARGGAASSIADALSNLLDLTASKLGRLNEENGGEFFGKVDWSRRWPRTDDEREGYLDQSLIGDVDGDEQLDKPSLTRKQYNGRRENVARDRSGRRREER